MRERSVGRHWSWVGVACVGCLFGAVGVSAQGQVAGPITLNDAIQLALKNYPAIKESRARAQAAEEAVGVARTAYLPRLDMIWQENRATTNNVFGLVLPPASLPSISGPVLGTRTLGDSVWSSAAGVLRSWEAVDLGQRKAHVDVASAADAFITVLAADESVRAARARRAVAELASWPARSVRARVTTR